MKKFLLVMLLLHVAMEAGLGLVLMLSPELFIPDADMNTRTSLTTYGGAAITMALVVAWYWPWRYHAAAASVALGTLATFHSLLAFAGLLIAMRGGNGAPLLVHAVIAAGFWWLWLKRRAFTAPA